MRMMEVKSRAKALGITPGRMNKTDLIRTIQREEGNFPCFKTAGDYCDQLNCCWREDCLSQSSAEAVTAKWLQAKQAYQRKMKEELEALKVKITELKFLAETKAGKGKDEVTEEIAKLENKMKVMREKLRGITQAGEHAWDEVKHGIDHAWDETRTLLKKTFSKFS